MKKSRPLEAVKFDELWKVEFEATEKKFKKITHKKDEYLDPFLR